MRDLIEKRQIILGNGSSIKLSQRSVVAEKKVETGNTGDGQK